MGPWTLAPGRPVGHTWLVDARFEVLDHTADTAVRVHAPSREALFALAARAMFSLMFDLAGAEVGRNRTVRLEAPNLDELLVDWLSALLSWSEIDRVAYFAVSSIEVGEQRIEAEVGGPPIDGLEVTGPPIKAVTYHGLEIHRTDGCWEATIVFDV